MNIKSLKNLPSLKYKLPSFYQDLLEHWLSFTNTKQQHTPHTFHEIRNRMLWGNQHLKASPKNKSFIFHSWIESNIFFINDIIDCDGNISQNVVLAKLKTKPNPISEFNIVKNSIPRSWKITLKSPLSKASNTKTCLRALDERFFHFTNKEFYRYLNNTQAEKPYIQHVWENTFNVDPYKWKRFYTHMHKSCSDNRIKQFKYKLLHNIIATNENLHTIRWKIASSPLCKKCHLTENYEHFFVSCECIQDFWKIINHAFTLCGYATNLQVLKRLLFG